MAAAIKLYYVPASPPARSVRMTARALGINLELKLVKLMEGEQFSPKYLKMNPMRTVPVLDDNGFIVNDSHAINAYLVSKYGKTDTLYPKDIKAKSVVDQRLHFNSGILFPRLRNIAFPILMFGETKISKEKRQAVHEAYDFLDALIADSKWIAGNEMTIADFSCVATISTLKFMVPKLEERANVWRWLETCKTQIDGYKELNQDGADLFEKMIMSKLKPNAKI